MREYNQIELYDGEYAFLKELELILGESIPNLDNLNRKMFGFIAKKGHILALALQNKNLSSIPESIGTLKSLNYLWLANNILQDIPQSLESLEVLTDLHIQANKFSSIPSWIKKIKNLKAINIGGNPLNDLS
ncbi:MAG: hypothetical protein ACTSUI_06235, partial [Promethearchaeota archaeon]